MFNTGPARARAAAPTNEEFQHEDAVGESASKEVFANYVCRTVPHGQPHPGDIAEASSLSAVALPKTEYPLWDSLPSELVAGGKLSSLQLEGILYACTKFQEILPSGERAGFFIGDGAGVGKGRQISGVMIDNFVRGRRRHLWLSTSSDLHLDALRDLRDLGCHITVINNCQELDREQKALGLSKDFQEGVLFMTYSTLTSAGRGGKSRMEQVIGWLGGPDFDGCLVFDECHKAKNFVPGKDAQSTKVSACVIELQQRLPRARVLYCSATGVSEVGNMAYMARMGLWGPATAFTDFQDFLETMRKRGVSFMEMLAMEMKAEGKYVARGLSFRVARLMHPCVGRRDAEFMEVEAPITQQQLQVYDSSVALWQALQVAIEKANQLCAVSHREVWKAYWAAQQRFFKMLCVSLKVPIVVALAREALAAGQSVVIGLQSTGEAAADALGLEPGPVPGFVCATKELLVRLVEVHLPTRMEVAAEAIGSLVGEPPVVPECLEIKQRMLEQIDALQLPPNFLDEIIDALGGPSQVAEMTGRKARVVQDAKGRFHYELRAKPDSTEMDSLNVREKELFVKGSKLVAIISDAASTGISLHASRECGNQRRRMHMTIELPWSADKAIQQLGRSHRSNQTSAPIYKLISTRVGGEKRFAAAVARRLQSLGALTRGDRRAASGIDLSEQNFDSPLGRKALRRMYDHIVQDSPALPFGVTLEAIYKDADLSEEEHSAVLSTLAEAAGNPALHAACVAQLHNTFRDCCDMMAIGLGIGRSDTVAEEKVKEKGKDLGDVRRFLNRILGLPVARQNLLFNYFAATLAAEISAAKAEGRYSEGVGDISASRVRRAAPPETLWSDPASTRCTAKNMLIIDRGVSFQDAVARLQAEAVPGDDSGFRRSKRPFFGRHSVVLALQKLAQRNAFAIVRPNTGDSYFDMERGELETKYVRISREEAEQDWTDMHEATLSSCMHGLACAQKDCQVGRRLQELCILSGSVVRVWGLLEAVLERNEHVLPRAERVMRVVRVALGDEGSLVGVRYPTTLLPEVVAVLSSATALASTQVPSGKGLAAGAAAALSGKLMVEPATPVDRKSLEKAFRPPRTLHDFFKPMADGKAPATKLGPRVPQAARPMAPWAVAPAPAAPTPAPAQSVPAAAMALGPAAKTLTPPAPPSAQMPPSDAQLVAAGRGDERMASGEAAEVPHSSKRPWEPAQSAGSTIVIDDDTSADAPGERRVTNLAAALASKRPRLVTAATPDAAATADSAPPASRSGQPAAAPADGCAAPSCERLPQANGHRADGTRTGDAVPPVASATATSAVASRPAMASHQSLPVSMHRQRSGAGMLSGVVGQLHSGPGRPVCGDEAMAQLLSMGFGSKQCEKALLLAHNNLQRALDWLLTGLT